MNAEFQRIARRIKKAFFSDKWIQGIRSDRQCLKNYGQRNIVQEAVFKTISKKKKCKKAK